MAVALLAALPTLVASAHAEEPAPVRHGLEGRAGVLVPNQVLDGASLHLALAWRFRLTGPLWLHVEGAANRTAITALTESVAAPGGAVTLRADHEQWTMPLIAGLSLQPDLGDGAGWGVLAGVGPALTFATLETSAVGGERLDTTEETRFDVVALGRLDLTWPVRPGALVVGVGWQEVLTKGDDRATGDVRASGLLLEAGWRALF